MSKEENLDARLEELAWKVKRELERRGCVRKADNLQPPYMLKEEIMEALDISLPIFKAVRAKWLELGIPITYTDAGKGWCTGYFVGFPGEQAKMTIHKHNMISGLLESIEDDMMLLGKSGSMKDAEQYFLLSPFNPGGIANAARALGKSFNKSAEDILLELGETVD